MSSSNNNNTEENEVISIKSFNVANKTTDNDSVYIKHVIISPLPDFDEMLPPIIPLSPDALAFMMLNTMNDLIEQNATNVKPSSLSGSSKTINNDKSNNDKSSNETNNDKSSNETNNDKSSNETNNAKSSNETNNDKSSNETNSKRYHYEHIQPKVYKTVKHNYNHHQSKPSNNNDKLLGQLALRYYGFLITLIVLLSISSIIFYKTMETRNQYLSQLNSNKTDN